MTGDPHAGGRNTFDDVISLGKTKLDHGNDSDAFLSDSENETDSEISFSDKSGRLAKGSGRATPLNEQRLDSNTTTTPKVIKLTNSTYHAKTNDDTETGGKHQTIITGKNRGFGSNSTRSKATTGQGLTTTVTGEVRKSSRIRKRPNYFGRDT